MKNNILEEISKTSVKDLMSLSVFRFRLFSPFQTCLKFTNYKQLPPDFFITN